MTSTASASADDVLPTEKKKRSGASQYRRKRISHPLDPEYHDSRTPAGNAAGRSTTLRKTKLTPKLLPDDPRSRSGSDSDDDDDDDDDDYIAGWKQVHRSPSNSPLPSSKSLTSLVAKNGNNGSGSGTGNANSAGAAGGAAQGGPEPQSREGDDENPSKQAVAAAPTSFAPMKKMEGSASKTRNKNNANHTIGSNAAQRATATNNTATATTHTKLTSIQSHSSSSSPPSAKLIRRIVDREDHLPLPPKKFGVVLLLALFLPFLACESIVMYLFYQYHGEVVDAGDEGGASSTDSRPFHENIAEQGIVEREYTEIPIQGDDDSATTDPMETIERRNDEYVTPMDGDESSAGNDANATEMKQDNVISVTRQTPPRDDVQTNAEDVDNHNEKTTVEQSGDDLPSLEDAEWTTLRTMLRSRFQSLQTIQSDTAEQHHRLDATAASICHMVWNRANSILAKMTDGFDDDHNDDNENESGGNATLEFLVLDSQKCMGGEILSGLSRDVDVAKLQVARDIFERLSHADPYDVDTQAGLGTCLLLQAIFGNLRDESDQTSLLTLAKFHLKVASSLCSGSKVPWNNDDNPDGQTRFPRFSGFHRRQRANPSHSNRSETESASSSRKSRSHVYGAAILHNLALAYIALGDSNSSVPVLLRAAALRREITYEDLLIEGHDHANDGSVMIIRPYWNMPEEVLLATEEKALLMAAKTKTVKREKKRRIPFLSISEDFNFEEMAMGI